MSQGNYQYLASLEKKPHVVGSYFKQIFMEMGEPLCTFGLYTKFKETPLREGSV
jgi:hypothetical protein